METQYLLKNGEYRTEFNFYRPDNKSMLDDKLVFDKWDDVSLKLIGKDKIKITCWNQYDDSDQDIDFNQKIPKNPDTNEIDFENFEDYNSLGDDFKEEIYTFEELYLKTKSSITINRVGTVILHLLQNNGRGNLYEIIEENSLDTNKKRLTYDIFNWMKKNKRKVFSERVFLWI